MSKMQRRKGEKAEAEVCKLAQAHGFTGLRTRSGGGQVRGDIAGIPGVALEVKRQERESVRAWFDQAAENCGQDTPIVAHRKNHGPWLATLELSELFALLKAREL